MGKSRKKVDLRDYCDCLIDLDTYKAQKSGMVESFATDKATAEKIREAEQAITELPDNYHIVNSEEKLKYLAKQIRLHKDFIFDCETSGLDPWRDKLYCISFWVGEQGYVIPIEHQLITCLSPHKVQEHLGEMFFQSKYRRTNHNIKFDGHFIRQQTGTAVGKLYCDTLVQSQVINPDTNMSHGLKELCAQYGISSDTGNYKAQFGKTAWSHLPWKLACYYAIKDCELVARLKETQDEVLADPDKEKLLRLFWDVEMPMLNLTFRMETRGMRVDQHYLNHTLIPTVHTEWQKAMEELREYVEPHLSYVKGESLQKVLDSPTKLEKIFFDKLDVPLIKFVTLKKDKEGKFTKRSLDKEAIAGTQRTCEVMRLLGDYRKWVTVKKMFSDTLPEKIVDGHVHPIMNVIGAATGRMSLSNPNLQQIPSRMGPLVRNLFVPKAGCIFMSADFSGQEMRILAHYSRDVALVKLYTDPNNKLDIYSLTAIMAFDDIDFHKSGTTKEAFASMPKGERKELQVYRDSKSLVLGLGYGMGPSKYARNTGKTIQQGKKDYNGYHTGFPRVGWYQKKCIELARKFGYITTLLGRRRYLPFINSTSDGPQRGSAERAAMNTPIQGSAADMVKLAALKAFRLIWENKWPIEIKLLVHDEIIFEMPIEWVPEHQTEIDQLVKVMTDALPLKVPMEMGVEFEERWGSKIKVEDIDLEDDFLYDAA